jgi:hypothetical protein
MMMQVVNVPELAALVGTSYPTMVRWLRAWKLVPDVRAPHGTGTLRLYGLRYGFAAYIAAALQRMAATDMAIAKAIRYLTRANLDRRIRDGQQYMVAAGDQLFIARADEMLRVQHSGMATVIDLGCLWRRWLNGVADLENKRAAREEARSRVPCPTATAREEAPAPG